MPVDIPKIHTDSKGDILFLQSQFKESAVPSLTSKSTDAKTQSALDMWIESLFEDASANIQVNGLEFKKAFEAVEEFEPFDTAVFERAQALGFQKSDLLVKIIELRKAVPAKIGQIVGEMTRMERARLANDTLEKFNIATDTWKDVQNLATFDSIKTAHSDTLTFIKELRSTMPTMPPKYESLHNIISDLESIAQPNKENADISSGNLDVEVREGAQGVSEGTSDVEGEVSTPRKARSGLVMRLQKASRDTPY